MRLPYIGRKNLSQLLRSARDEHELPEGLSGRVRAAIAGATRLPRAHRARASRKLAWAFGLALGCIALLVAALQVADHGRAPRGAHVTSRRAEPRQAALLTVVSARPVVTDSAGRTLRVGSRVPAGGVVRTGERGRATLVTRRGSEFTLGAKSELSLAADGRRARLERGRLYCRNRLHEFAEIITSAGQIRLSGTAVDAEMQDESHVAVTVVEGRVQLANAHGAAVVGAGRRALLVASLPPDEGAPTNVAADTAWYDGRGAIVSDYGQIAYAVRRGDDPITEIWTMSGDGGERRRVKTYLGYAWQLGPWLSGEQVLFVQPDSLQWSFPDTRARLGHGHTGAAVLGLKDRKWLLNAATGLDAPLGLPESLAPVGPMVLSPDATRLLVGGYKEHDPAEGEAYGHGTWVYDLLSGTLTRLMVPHSFGTPAWAPDGSALAMPLELPQQHITGRLSFVNAATGEVVDFGVQAEDVSFSPDGDYIAYNSDFKEDVGRHRGCVFVQGIAAGSQPYRVSPEGEGANYPEWSPDGTRIAYWVWPPRPQPDPEPWPETMVCVAAADGSGAWEIYRGLITKAPHWTPSGDAVYVTTRDDGILVAAADGSGVTTVLAGTAADSVLSPAQQADTQLAAAAIQEAMFQFSVGVWRAYQGRVRESNAAFHNSAAIFASLPWSYPNADLSMSNVMLYADTAQALGDRPPQAVHADACQMHLAHIGWLISAREQKQEPPAATLEELLAWGRGQPLWLDHWLSTRTDGIRVMLRCPEGYLYTYTVPGTQGEAASVMCPHHSQGEDSSWVGGSSPYPSILKQSSNLGGRSD